MLYQEQRQGEWEEGIFKNTIGEHFAELVNNIKLQIKEAP